jgi:hypothetical protein
MGLQSGEGGTMWNKGMLCIIVMRWTGELEKRRFQQWLHELKAAEELFSSPVHLKWL